MKDRVRIGLDLSILQNQIIICSSVFVGSCQFWLYLRYQQHTESMKYLNEIYKKILAQNESNYIVNKLEESIIIVNDNRNDRNCQLGYQIEFVNDLFLDQFKDLLLTFTSKKEDILKNLKINQPLNNFGIKFQKFAKNQKAYMASCLKQFIQLMCNRNPFTYENMQQFDEEEDKIEFFELSSLKAKVQNSKEKLEELKAEQKELNFLNVKIFDVYTSFFNCDVNQQTTNTKSNDNMNQTQLNGIDHAELLLNNLKQRQTDQNLQQTNENPQLSLIDILKFGKEKIDNSIFQIRNTDMFPSQLYLTYDKHSKKKKNSKQKEGVQKYRYVQIKKTEMKRNNKTFIILQIVDISHSILYNQSQAKNDLLSLINACVSHELRNPLNAIIAQNINKEYICKNIRKHLDTITSKDDIDDFELNVKMPIIDYLNELDEGLHVQQASASLMDFIVQDLLDYSQIKAGKFRLNIQPFDIIDAIENVMSIQKLTAHERGIDFYIVAQNFNLNQNQIIKSNSNNKINVLKNSKIQIKEVKDENLPMNHYMINCDRQRVMQVLLGLQSNALKFTKEGSVSIHLKIIEVAKQQYLQISVIDTGVGIEKKDKDKLFQFFGFLQDTKQMNTKGIGLGLVIADQIVQKFEGEISFQSIPGKGSNFTYSMKLFDQQEIEAKQSLYLSSQNQNENKYLPNSKELIYNWIPTIQRQIKEQITQNITKKGIQHKTITTHLADTIQYIQQFQENDNNLQAPQLKNQEEKSNNQEAKNMRYIKNQNNDYLQPPINNMNKKQNINKDVQVQKVNQNKILIVDDQEYNILSLKVILKSLQLDIDLFVEHAMSGEEALEKVVDDVQEKNNNLKCTYDLILMDCQMPYMDGYETCQKIREFIYQKRLPQPIISAVTGHTEQEYINRAIESGMNQVLTKPVQLNILVYIVSYLGYQVKYDAA